MSNSIEQENAIIDFDSISSELNNKTIIAVLDDKSPSYKTFGPTFIGRLLGRTRKQRSSISKTVVSLTILSHEFLTHNIPVEDIRFIIEML
jgi:hypothetical protein